MNWKPRGNNWTTIASSPCHATSRSRPWPMTRFPDLEKRVADLERELQIALLPPDENEDRDAIVEIRAGTGGSEAAIFAADLYRMYNRYAESRRVKDRRSRIESVGARRIERSDLPRFGRIGFPKTSLREWRASRATRAGDGSARPHSYFDSHGRGFAGSGRGRYRTEAGRFAN